MRTKQRGFDIEERFADKHVTPRTLREMPDYYSSIDVYVCASITEGTPNPILEAMASGVPIVTTDVGIVRKPLVVSSHNLS